MAADARNSNEEKKIGLGKLNFQENEVWLSQVDLHALLAGCRMSLTSYLSLAVA
jgi:hypothetical protein